MLARRFWLEASWTSASSPTSLRGIRATLPSGRLIAGFGCGFDPACPSGKCMPRAVKESWSESAFGFPQAASRFAVWLSFAS